MAMTYLASIDVNIILNFMKMVTLFKHDGIISPTLF
jgi:hypothetical protein